MRGLRLLMEVTVNFNFRDGTGLGFNSSPVFSFTESCKLCIMTMEG